MKQKAKKPPKSDTGSWKAFLKVFIAHGNECGCEIARLLQEKFPNAEVFPLYRSAIAIEYDTEKSLVLIHTSGDPHFMGQDITAKEIPFYGETYAISGQRIGPDILKQVFGEWQKIGTQEYFDTLATLTAECKPRRT